jgi:hypothetical protein
MVSVPSSQRHGTRWPCRCTPPIHRLMPLRATWSAWPASTRAPVPDPAQFGRGDVGHRTVAASHRTRRPAGVIPTRLLNWAFSLPGR